MPSRWLACSRWYWRWSVGGGRRSAASSRPVGSDAVDGIATADVNIGKQEVDRYVCRHDAYVWCVCGGCGWRWWGVGVGDGPAAGGVSTVETTPGQQVGPQVADLGFRNTAAVDWTPSIGLVCVCSRVVMKSDWPYLAMTLVQGMCGVERSRTCSTT